MRHRKTIKKLGLPTAHRKALLKNLANSLILYEKIITTEAKAKALKAKMEKMITRAKVDNLHNRRLLLAKLPTKNSVKKMLEILGPKYRERRGGYLRIVKLNPRRGDAAKMAMIEFV